MPGIKPEDIEITVTGDTLTIRGEVRDQPPGEEARYHQREHRYGTFARSITLPVEVQSDKVEATFEHGMLTLTMPKAERMRPKQIKITTRGGAAQIGTQGGAASSAPTIEGQTTASTATTSGASAAAGPSDETAAAPSAESTAPKRSRKKST
jgi:hypothetical protein